MDQNRLRSQDPLRRAIRLHSENLGMSQVELAESADISQPLISGFMTGNRNLSDANIDKVRRALSRVVQGRIAALGAVLGASGRDGTSSMQAQA
jgi:predicted transcriptional regulator